MQQKYQSPSTTDIKHDPTNLLVEFLMLNKYGVLGKYPWRKGQPLATEWGQVCKVVRRLVKTMKISPSRLGWYIYKHNVTAISYEEFGLVKWKINKYFPYGDLAKITSSYKTLLKTNMSKIEQDRDLTVYYRTKAATVQRKSSLLDVLKQLEEQHESTGSEILSQDIEE